MSELHISIHGGSVTFWRLKEIIEKLENIGYEARVVDNGTIILNIPEPEKKV